MDLATQKALRLTGPGYLSLAKAVMPVDAAKTFLALPASEQAFGLSMFAAIGGDKKMFDSRQSEFKSLRTPQFISLENLQCVAAMANRLQKKGWIPAAVSDTERRLFGGQIGKWIR
jgi:hypothetical protein